MVLVDLRSIQSYHVEWHHWYSSMRTNHNESSLIGFGRYDTDEWRREVTTNEEVELIVLQQQRSVSTRQEA